MKSLVITGFIGGMIPIGLVLYVRNHHSAESRALSNKEEEVFRRKVERAQQMQNPADAIALLKIPSTSKHFQVAQQLQQTFSRQILENGEMEHRQGNLAKAITVLRAIPPSDPVANRAQSLQKVWIAEAKQLGAVRGAISQGKWMVALQGLEKLSGSELFGTPLVQNSLQQVISQATPQIVITASPPTPIKAPVLNPLPELALPNLAPRAIASDVTSMLIATAFRTPTNDNLVPSQTQKQVATLPKSFAPPIAKTVALPVTQTTYSVLPTGIPKQVVQAIPVQISNGNRSIMLSQRSQPRPTIAQHPPLSQKPHLSDLKAYPDELTRDTLSSIEEMISTQIDPRVSQNRVLEAV